MTHRRPLGPAAAQCLRAARGPGDDGVAAAPAQRARRRCAPSASTASRSTRRCSSHYMETTVGIVTALNPVLGYEKATELANEAYRTGKGLLEVIREKKVLTEEQIKDLLDPVKLANLDKSKYQKVRTAKQPISGQCTQSRRRVTVCVRTSAFAFVTAVTLALFARRAQEVASTRRQSHSRRSRNIVILATGGTIAGAAATRHAIRLHLRRSHDRCDAGRCSRHRQARDRQGRADFQCRLAGHVVRHPAQGRQTHQRARGRSATSMAS